MDLFFADDSKQKGVREGMGVVVALGGIFVEETALRSLSDSIDEIASTHCVPKGEELKWSPRKGTWIHCNLHGDARTDCYRMTLQAAIDHGVRAIVICWDTGQTTLKGDNAFNKCVDYLFERISVNLEKRDTSAILVSDRPGGGKDQEDKFLSDFVSRVQSGTEYVVPDRILLNVLTTPSHLVRHLQVADLVTGITTAMVCGLNKYAEPLFDLVKQMLVTNYMNYIGGTGLKLFPDQLLNLYFHILKEETFWRVGRNLGVSLPHWNFPYAENAFKIK